MIIILYTALYATAVDLYALGDFTFNVFHGGEKKCNSVGCFFFLLVFSFFLSNLITNTADVNAFDIDTRPLPKRNANNAFNTSQYYCGFVARLPVPSTYFIVSRLFLTDFHRLYLGYPQGLYNIFT